MVFSDNHFDQTKDGDCCYSVKTVVVSLTFYTFFTYAFWGIYYYNVYVFIHMWYLCLISLKLIFLT